MSLYYYERYKADRTYREDESDQQLDFSPPTTMKGFPGYYTSNSLDFFRLNGESRTYYESNGLSELFYYPVSGSAEFPTVMGYGNYENGGSFSSVEYTKVADGYKKGIYVDTITAVDGSYPTDGHQGEYWYVKKTAAVSPTLTAPNGNETVNATFLIEWTENEASNKYQIQLSADGGQTWKDIIAQTSVGATSFPYDFSDETASSVSLVRIRSYEKNNLYSEWDESDGVFTIRHNVAPNAPTNLSPSSGAPVDRAVVNRLSWLYNDPNSGDSQSKYDLQWRPQSNTNWNTVSRVTVNNNNNNWDAPANTFPYGGIEWRVRTYDQAGLSSSYSAVEIFFAGDKPSAPTITNPADTSTVSVANPTVQWSSSGQVSYLLKVLDSASTEIYSFSGSTNKAHTVQYDLANQTDYRIELSITNADGLISDADSVAITVSYTPPAKAILTATSDADRALITLNVDNPMPAGTEPSVAYNNVYRRKKNSDWIRIAKELPISTNFTDYTPASGQLYEYYVRAWGDNGTYSDSEVASKSIILEHAYLSATSGYSQSLPLDKVTDTNKSSNAQRSMMQFAGRPSPVAYFGESSDSNINLEAFIQGRDTMTQLRQLANSREILLYRDERGRKEFVTMNGVEEKDMASGYYSVPLNMVRTSYSEVV